MKTPDYFVQRWETLSTLLFESHSTKSEVKASLAKFIEEEIQRDARDGTVPVEDVRPLIELLRDNPNADVRLARYELRAKHPNLFTI